VQVAAISLIIALGSGFYSGLASTSTWRRDSYDASYRALRMFDLHMTLASGGYVRSGRLLDVLASVPDAWMIDGATERLVGATQVDASAGGRTILVPGRIVGLPVGQGAPLVTAVAGTGGRSLRRADAGRSVGLLDVHFARHYGLPETGRLALGGGGLRYVGLGVGPEYFIIVGEQRNILAEANFAVVFTSLQTAQRLLARRGLVNDLVVTVRPGADVQRLAGEISAAMRRQLPTTGFELTRKEEDDTYRLLYNDIDSDQQLYSVFAVLILLGAAFASFNLVTRMVEAQRREIGIGMALGAPPRLIAVRPLLVGLEVALIGALLGVAVGVAVDSLLGGVFRTYQPLPVWRTEFQPLLFLEGAAIGLALPFLASAYPVWRAVRVAPIEAIRTGALAARTSGLAPILGRIPLPGRSFVQMPFRNVLRTPRRSLMTTLGLAASIALLVGAIGMVDSFLRTIDLAQREVERESPDRLAVGMRFNLISSPDVQGVVRSPAVSRASPGIEVGGRLRHGDRTIDVIVEVLDFQHGLWRPSVTEGSLASPRPAIVLTRKAARDLGVHAGDTVVLRHPRRVGVTSYRFVDSPVLVTAVNPLPNRFTAFMDLRWAGLMNLRGITNRVSVEPAPGMSADEVKKALFRLPGVTSVQPVSAFTDTVREALTQRLEIMRVIEGAVLVLALLIAFNSTSISVDERSREHATMFAFGLPTRTVLLMAIAESVTIGLAGTLIGLGLGRLLLGWMIDTIVATVVPDIGVVTFVSAQTVLTAVALGVIAVAVAPILVLHRLRRMDIPATLRVVE
jgi:putative ABC transport system permease protein